MLGHNLDDAEGRVGAWSSRVPGRAEAAAALAKVKATGLFPGAYLKRTSTGFNGT